MKIWVDMVETYGPQIYLEEDEAKPHSYEIPSEMYDKYVAAVDEMHKAESEP